MTGSARVVALRSPRAEQPPACFYEVMDALHEGVALFDAQDRFVFWNRRWAEIYSLSAAALCAGGAYAAFVRGGVELGQYLDAQGRAEAWLAERLGGEAAVRRERLPGDRWVRVKVQALPDGGRLRTVLDVTSAQRTDNSFRLLFDDNPLAMSLCDAKTMAFMAVNEAAVAKYGYSRQAMLGGMTMIDLAPPEVREGTKSIMSSKIGAYDGQAVWTQVAADGARIHIRPYVRPLIYEGRACLLCAAVDVTETVRAEKELRRAREAADAAALDAFRQSLRGPLESLMGPAQALAERPSDDETRALAAVVREAALSLERALAG